MKEFPELNQRQWNCLCDFHMNKPVPLEKADLGRPFVYERQYGLFYVPFGFHQSAMSFLLALQHGLDHGIEVAEKLKLKYSEGTADYWLENTPGAAFRSSVGKRIQVATGRGLTPQERRLFGDVDCVFTPTLNAPRLGRSDF
jgi:hypothetical protein